MAGPNQFYCPPQTFTNYVAYHQPERVQQHRIGHLDIAKSTIQPLSFASGSPIYNLYQVIEADESEIEPSGDPIALSSVELLPPLSGRDVLAVGKNYIQHTIEINASGYDCDHGHVGGRPTRPEIFTKRSTSIIASGEPIYPHPGFTEKVDYEGEIGVIIGKPGFRIQERDAMEHVWGYTIINDVTARDRQRDHKQFYISKSPDTFCPMGPIAVPAHRLPKVLRIQTFVNGEKRQDSATEDLLFSIPTLIKTISEAQALQLGDVLATGTPGGAGIGQKPPVFLKSGDKVEISVTGLGMLRNTIADPTATDQTIALVSDVSYIPEDNSNKTYGGVGLTSINSKLLYHRHLGLAASNHIIFIHGLGGTSEYWTPLISLLGLEKTHSLHLMDLEGQGLSITHPLSKISISSYADDFYALAQQFNISRATVISHSMGCMIALTLATKHPELVSKLVLMGPPSSPVAETNRNMTRARAAIVRKSGIAPVVDGVVAASTSSLYKPKSPTAIMAIRATLLSQDPEGYAKGCMALADCLETIPVGKIKCPTLMVAGEEDRLALPSNCTTYKGQIEGSVVEILSQVAHWHIFEDVEEVANVVGNFI